MLPLHLDIFLDLGNFEACTFVAWA